MVLLIDSYGERKGSVRYSVEISWEFFELANVEEILDNDALNHTEDLMK